MQAKKYTTQLHNLYLTVSKTTKNKSSSKLTTGISLKIPKKYSITQLHKLNFKKITLQDHALWRSQKSSIIQSIQHLTFGWSKIFHSTNYLNIFHLFSQTLLKKWRYSRFSNRGSVNSWAANYFHLQSNWSIILLFKSALEGVHLFIKQNSLCPKWNILPSEKLVMLNESWKSYL